MVAVLQRRGKFNHEKMGPESFPGACQVTVHGKVEEGESFLDGLDRETLEELGLNLRGLTDNDCMECIGELLSVLIVEENEEKHVITSGLYVKPEVVKRFTFSASTGGLEFITREGVDKVRNLQEFNKTIGVTDFNIVAMFPDEIVALQKAFEVFGK